MKDCEVYIKLCTVNLVHRKKRFATFSSQAGMSLTQTLRREKFIHTRESLVSDIPAAGDGKISNLFLQCSGCSSTGAAEIASNLPFQRRNCVKRTAPQIYVGECVFIEYYLHWTNSPESGKMTLD
jgi:hypothetical protein